MRVRPVVAVSTAAVVGATSRWGLESLAGQDFGLFIANVAGCGLIGLAVGSQENRWDQSWLTIGLCGSLTSFASFTLLLARSLESSNWSHALAWCCITLCSCCFSFVVGSRIRSRK
ncbi:MAG TPA: hypothetical protein DEB44_01200 [Acidimicrobiaceae bacterium]|nr:hypothetical protein [Acidimicrobiaceae bacterium]